jgi:nicotinamide riboside transporter PnuC
MRDSIRPLAPNRVPLVNLVVGILVLISPWALHHASGTATWDLTITGIVIGIVALIAMGAHGKGGYNFWPTVNVFLGLWLLISLGFMHGDAAIRWTTIVLGLLAVVAGLVSQSYEEPADRPRHA